MKINRDNYEQFFIDYYDGTLSNESVADLYKFLEIYPELKNEFENFADVRLNAPDMVFPYRDSLKRGEINFQNYSWFLIASLEGDLSHAEEILLSNFLEAHPKLKKEKELYSLTKIVPLAAGKFDNKEALKQPLPFSFTNRSFQFAAAAILFLLLMSASYYLFVNVYAPVENMVAETPVSNNKHKLSDDNKAVKPGNLKAVAATKGNSVKNRNKRPFSVPIAVHSNTVQPVIANVNEIEDKVFAASVLATPLIEYKMPEMAIANISPAPIIDRNRNEEEFLTVWEALKQVTRDNLKKSYSQNEPVVLASNESNEIRLIDIVGKGINLLSRDKVKLDRNYNIEDQSASYRFSAGQLKIEKN
jgi:hypothetical protein